MLKRICCLFLTASLAFSSFCQGLTKAEEKSLISNLNYLQYSITKIKESENKAIAEDEYYSVINELSMNSINNDELKEQYELFLMGCSELKLNENEKNFLREVNTREMKDAWGNAFASIGSIFVPGRTLSQTALSLVYATTANIINVYNNKNQLKTQLEKDLFYLNQESLATILNMQTDLFSTCMSLLGGNDLEGRITENSMKAFTIIRNNPDIQERMVLLSEDNLKENLKSFPPYWYELGNAYQLLGKTKEAMYAYDKFEELKKYDVIDKDRTYIRLLKNKIQVYLGADRDYVISADNMVDGDLIKKNASKNKRKILKCIELINKNVLDTDAGEKNAYLAKIYFLLGDTESSLQCINYIINTKSVNAEYVNDVIKLKELITASTKNENSELYQNLFKFNSIGFGTDSSIYSESFGFYEPESFFQKSKNFVADKIAGLAVIIDDFGKGESEKYKVIPETDNNLYLMENGLLSNGNDVTYFVDNKSICFTVPKNITQDYDLYVSAGNKRFNAIKVSENDSETLYFADYPVAGINKMEPDSSINLVLHFVPLHRDKKESPDREIQVTYSIKYAREKVYEEAEKAFERIGTDINSYNSDLSLLFGKQLVDSRFSYRVNNPEKLKKDIRKKIERMNSKRDVPLTYEALENEIKLQSAQQLQSDMNNLQAFFGSVSEDYFNYPDTAYKSVFVKFYDDIYSVGIVCIYDTYTKKQAGFDAAGDVNITVLE